VCAKKRPEDAKVVDEYLAQLFPPFAETAVEWRRFHAHVQLMDAAVQDPLASGAANVLRTSDGIVEAAQSLGPELIRAGEAIAYYTESRRGETITAANDVDAKSDNREDDRESQQVMLSLEIAEEVAAIALLLHRYAQDGFDFDGRVVAGTARGMRRMAKRIVSELAKRIEAESSATLVKVIRAMGVTEFADKAGMASPNV
jgi:hypothetical protein